MQFLITAIVAVILLVGVVSSCPSVCSCTDTSDGDHVNCSSRGLDSIPTDLPNNTYILQLLYNKISVIEDNTFNNLPRLYSLKLQYNNISVIENNAFNNLPNLRYLYLHHNKITSIKLDMFNNLTNLVRLDLQYNDISVIENNAFNNLPNLRYLQLGSNDIPMIEDNTFSNLPNLQYLYLGSNDIPVIEDNTFSNLPNLQYLHLGSNDIPVIEDNTFSNLPNLQRLYLHSNQITSIKSDIFNNLTNLNTLYLSSNKITSIKSDMFNNLTNLKVLSLSGNDIPVIEDNTFSNLPNLQNLYLSGNKITSIKSDMFNKLTNLKALGLNNNEISMIEDNTFSNLPNLQYLYLYGNKITSIKSDMFNNLTNLKHLQLDTNGITVIENNTFSNLPNLQYLYLYNNKITSIKSNTFINLTNLNKLSLFNNKITSIKSDAFSNLTNLNKLSLTNNPISFVSESAFVNLPKLTSLDFHMYCGGCENIPFWRWLRNQTTISVTCNDYDGESLAILEPNNFTDCFNTTTEEPTTIPTTIPTTTTTTTTTPPTTTMIPAVTPCTSNGLNRTDMVLGEECGKYGVDGRCTVLHSACMQSKMDTSWKCRCSQGYAKKNQGCVAMPNQLFSSGQPVMVTVQESTTSGITIKSINFDEVSGFDVRKPTAEVKGPESSLFTVTANTNGVTLKLSKRLDQLNYVIFVTVSVTIDNVVIRDFVEVRISVSPEDVIRQNIVILHGTPERSIIGQICKSCFTGSDVISVSNSDVYDVNMEGSVVTAKTINLDTLQSTKTIFNSTYILVNKNTDLIANVTIIVIRSQYTVTLDEHSEQNTQVALLNNIFNTFVIDTDGLGTSASGDVINLGSTILDYEKQTKVTKTLSFSNIIMDSLNVSVTIKIQDVNDVPPKFQQKPYNFLTFQSSHQNLIIGVVKADDPDMNSKLIYSINPSDVLSINEQGVIKADNPITKSNYTANVTVSDGRQIDTVVIVVNLLLPTNTNLKNEFTGTINENTNASALISNVSINGYTNYRFTDQAAYSDLRLDSDTGLVKSRRSFDRENVHERQFNFTIVGNRKNQVSCSLVIIGEITVNVIDVNDEPPVFINTPYTATVVENSSGKQLKMNLPIDTTDKDVDPIVSYSLVNHQDKFDINSLSGIIKAKADIDRETTPILHVSVKASDGVNSATTVIVVNIEDINDNPPSFTSTYSFTVDENSQIGKSVGNISASDSDIGKNAQITYQIHSDGGYFRINQTTGEITISRNLDREMNAVHKPIVYARDNGDNILSSSVTVTISVNDINDNAPSFSSDRIMVEFEENKNCSNTITTLLATDSDKPNSEYSRITYSLLSGSGDFQIDPSTGSLRCKTMLDYEKINSYTLLVKAQDNGSPALSSNTTVIINVKDINDNTPTFVDAKDSITIRYFSGSIERLIEVLYVVDLDNGDNGNVSLSISGSAEAFLTIDSKGVLKTKALPNNPKDGSYNLRITATDMGTPSPLTSSHSMNVTVSQVSQPITFSRQEIMMTVMENSNIGVEIGSISTAVNKTSGTIVTFEIINEKTDVKFSLNSDDGKVTLKNYIDREIDDIHEFVVRVKNKVDDAQSDLALVRVQILDENDNKPIFDRDAFYFQIREDSSSDTIVNPTGVNVIATDADIDTNAEIKYKILESDGCADLFTFKENSIVLRVTIDYELYNFCKLTVKAYNPNNETMSSTVNIDINVLDVNDNPPEFLQHTNNVYTVTVREDITINTEIPLLGLLRDKDSRENGDIELSTVSSCLFDVRRSNMKIQLQLKGNTAPDFESSIHTYTCIIKAIDKGAPPLTATATLSISITDVNDNWPQITSPNINVNVSRDAKVKHVIISQIPATDADSSENGQLLYSLQNSQYSSKFTIDPTTGSIDINNVLNYVQTDKITLIVIVSDKGIPPLSSTAVVTMLITDDNPRPYLEQTPVINIQEHTLIEDSIVHVKAYDGVNANGVVKECDCLFRLDTNRDDLEIDNNGNVRFKSPANSFDREKEANSKVFISVIATDKDDSPKDSDPMIITIHITDINDQYPRFTQDMYHFKVYQKAPNGVQIGTVTAIDKDLDPDTRYSINITESSFGSSVVSINETTGEITKSGDMTLNQTSNTQIMGRVYAQDNKDLLKLPDSTEITITIEFDDKNNHTPTFQRVKYDTDMMWDAEVEHSIVQTMATDADSGVEGTISYSIVEGNSRGFFKMDNNGMLILAYTLDSSIGMDPTEFVTLTVKAMDGGIIPKYSSVQVIIRISGNNPGVCIQGTAHSKQVLDITEERNNWSYALYALVTLLCIAIVCSLFFLYKWRTASVSTSSNPIDKDSKHKYISSESDYNALGKRSTVEYSHSNQGFDSVLNYDPYSTPTDIDGGNEPTPDYDVTSADRPAPASVMSPFTSSFSSVS